MQFINKLLNKKKEPQENLIQIQNKKRHEILKNRLFITSLLNLLIFLIFVFSMCFYKWGLIQIQIYQPNPKTADSIKDGYITIYFNLIYGKQLTRSYYQTFPQLSAQICISNDINCTSTFQELMCIGYLCFIILVIGSMFQMYDIYKMIHFFCRKENDIHYTEQKRDNLRHILTIGHFIIGITLNLFGLYFLNTPILIDVSFWIFVGGIILFIFVIIYEQISLIKLRHKQLVINLMQRQRLASNQANNQITIQLSCQNDKYI